MSTIIAKAIAAAAKSAVAYVWRQVKWASGYMLASIYAFVASPKVWAAGVLAFTTGWVAAFMVGHAKRHEVRPDPALAQVRAQLAASKGVIGNLQAEVARLGAQLQEAEAKRVEAEAAAAAKPKVVYRRVTPKAPADTGVRINWPKW